VDDPICGKTQAQLLDEARGKQSKILVIQGAAFNAEWTLKHAQATLNNRSLTSFYEFSKLMWNNYQAPDTAHYSVDIGVEKLFDSYTDLYKNSNPPMGYIIIQLGNLKMIERVTQLK